MSIIVDSLACEIRSATRVCRYVGPGDRWEVTSATYKSTHIWCTGQVAGSVGHVAVIGAVAGLSREDFAGVLAALIGGGVTAEMLLPRVAP